MQKMPSHPLPSQSVQTPQSVPNVKSPPQKPPLKDSQTHIETPPPKGLEPTRYGDWERGGRCSDF